MRVFQQIYDILKNESTDVSPRYVTEFYGKAKNDRANGCHGK